MRSIFTTILFMVGWQVYAQQCDEKHILTGPSGTYSGSVISPANPEQSSNVSRFNWMLNPTTDGVQFRFTPVNSTNKSLLSPWHISDPNIDYYKLAKGTNSDYKPSDGWEVFKVNLGRLNDDVTMRLTPTLVPYIMLYNRYTGILRVFGYLDRTSDYHQMVITLSYDKPNGTNGLNYSALLSLNDKVHQPLESKTSVDEIKAITNYANNQYIFFWADFPLAYDPCVCLYKSNLSVRFKAVQTATINLTGSIIGKVEPIATPPTDFQKAAKFVSSAINIGKAVYTGNYADFASSVSTVLGGFTNLNPGIQEGMDNFLNVLQLGLTINNLSNTNPQTKSDKPLSEKEKTEKTIAAVSTYFSALAKSGSSNTMALTASAILNGTSLSEYDFGNSLVRFSTPGSKDSHLNPQENYNNVTDANGNVRPEYVAYNEILGTFALLKKPVINISYQETSQESCGCDPNNRFYVQTNRIRFQIPRTYTENGVTQNNPLLYAFNPIMHANLNNTKVKVALVFKEQMGSNCYPGGTGIYNNDPLVNLTPLTSTYPNITEIIIPVSYDEGYSIHHYEHDWQPGSNNAENTCDTYEFISPLVPLDFIYDLNGQMTIFNSYWEPYGTWAPGGSPIDEVLLKFYIDFESTDIGSNGQPNKSTLVFTYPVKVNQVSEFPINGVIDFTQYRPAINQVTQSQINQFCTGQFENTTYHAKELLATTTNKVVEVNNNILKEISGVQLSAKPNPSKGEVNLNYTLTKETAVVISVYNMNMQKVATDMNIGKRPKGVYNQKLQLGDLSSGVYLIQLKTSEKIISTKLILTK
jgi:hypothetical protein